jgi:hypothetical protein
MATKAPKTCQHLSADALFGLLRTGFAAIADHRPGPPDLSLAEALLSAFAMFSLTSPALLAFDRERPAGNLHRVYGLERVPGDPSRRALLAPVAPESLRPLYTHLFSALQRSKALKDMVFVQDHYLIALDGTGYFSSQQIHCASCLETPHRTGTVPYRHQMLGAARIHPDKHEVIPLMPEPIIKQEGTNKNDCERSAAQRLIATLRQDPPPLQFIVTDDRLRSNAPHIEVWQDHQRHYLLGGKEGAHVYLFEHVAAAERAGRGVYYDRDDAKPGRRHRFRFVSDVPLNAAHAALRVNVLECWEWDRSTDTAPHFRGVPALRVNNGTVYQLMRGGRASWRIENETCNTRKNPGDHFAHHFGQGSQHLSVGFALLMMLAFLVDQVQQLGCPLFQAVGATLGSKRRRWERRSALCSDYALASMRQRFDALFSGSKKTAPVLEGDSS